MSSCGIHFMPSMPSCPSVLSVMLTKPSPSSPAPRCTRLPQHAAAQEDHPGILQRLLASGANANQESEFGWTPIMLASASGSAACVRLLLEAGARVTAASTNNREQPVHFAAYNGHTEVRRARGEGGVQW